MKRARSMTFLRVLLACVLAMNMFACPVAALASVDETGQAAKQEAVASLKESSESAPSEKTPEPPKSDSDQSGKDAASSKDPEVDNEQSDKNDFADDAGKRDEASAPSVAVSDKETENGDRDVSSEGANTPSKKDQSSTGALDSESDGSAKASSQESSKPEIDQKESEDKARGTELDENHKIEKIVISYITEEDYKKGLEPKEFDPSDATQKVAIAKREGRLRLTAVIHYTDGTTESSSESDTSIKWQITSTKASDFSAGQAIIAKLQKIGTVGSNKWLTATAQGNGEVTLVCSSRVHPDFKGQTFKVTITGNEFKAESSGSDQQSKEPLKVKTAVPFAVNDLSINSSTSEGKISKRFGSCQIDFVVTLTDGSVSVASDLGLSGTYSVSKSYGTSGSATTSTIAKVTPDGCVWALGAGNGSVDVSCKFGTFAASTLKVRITGNELPGTTDQTPVSLTFAFTDANHQTSIAYSEKNLGNESKMPLIADERGSVTFIPRLNMPDGKVTNAYDSAYDIQWKLERLEDEDGKITNSQLGYLSPTGKFTALNQGNGYAYISAKLVGANVPSVPTSLRVKIRNNDNKPYVKSIKILGTNGQDLGDGGIDVSKVGAAHKFHVLVEYNDGTQKNNFFGDKIEGLQWKTVRPVSNADELYSHIDSNGNFFTDAGFLECKLVATIKEADKYGNDISKELRIYDGKETERVGYSSNLTVRIVYESEYRKFGNAAQPAKEIDVTYEDLMAKAQPYTDWFTFRTNGGSWGTIYANGVSIPKLLSAISIDVNDMRFMQFSDKLGYTGDSGFYSDSVILGSRYRYSNYYMHAASLNPGYLGQSSVVPMLATSLKYDYGNDYNGGYSGMARDTTFRLLMGMTGVEDGNARRMVRCVSDITVMVTDPPKEKPAPGSQGGSGDGNGTGGNANTGGTGNGIGSGTGDGSGSDIGGGGGSGDSDGQAQDGSGGQDSSLDADANNGGGQSQASENNADVSLANQLMSDGRSMKSESGTLLVRELTPQEIEELEDLMPIPWMDRNNPFRVVAVILAIASLVISALYYERRYRSNLDIQTKGVPAS